MAKILIIDDDPAVCDMLSKVIKKMGHLPAYVHTLKQGVDEVQSADYDVVLLDVRMPDGNGLYVLPLVKKAPSQPEVIIITAAGDPEGAELAIANGAWDYMPKRASLKEMTLPLIRALQYREEKRARRPLAAVKRGGIVGSSPLLNECLDLLAQTATSDSPVLLTGDTGTGKELFARAIHHNSHRANGKFVVVDCAALPENLVESTLFGHEKGAFTGADRPRQGVIKQADGGTLFLDEVGELPLSVQKAFLRVLQENRFRPVGGQVEVTSDFRLVAATNMNLEAMVQAGTFRQDLLYRIRSHTINLPPLRERLSDIKELTLYYIAGLCERYGTDIKGVSPDFYETLLRYDWPGNIRELINTLERALSAAYNAPTLFATHLPTHIRAHAARASVQETLSTPQDVKKNEDLLQKLPPLAQARELMLRDFERQYLQDLLSMARGSVTQAARMAGVSRQRLHELLKKYQVNTRK
ncbi:MAG: sigma-54 dependent transcriptional regulator [Pseudomonadota bacterium]